MIELIIVLLFVIIGICCCIIDTIENISKQIKTRHKKT